MIALVWKYQFYVWYIKDKSGNWPQMHTTWQIVNNRQPQQVFPLDYHVAAAVALLIKISY